MSYDMKSLGTFEMVPFYTASLSLACQFGNYLLTHYEFLVALPA